MDGCIAMDAQVNQLQHTLYENLLQQRFTTQTQVETTMLNDFLKVKQ